MKIKKFAFGSDSVSFIESRFGEHLNIIFSNDNNKGKTLVLQGIMYALGNEPIFPAGFDNSTYYFFLEFELDNNTFKILRRNNTFTVLVDSQLNILESASEFKYFFDKNIFKLPEIVHRGLPKIVDLSLFLQIFFVGQDKRDTSNIFNSGYYNKSDFIEMLYALNGIAGTELSSDEIKKFKGDLKQLRIKEAKLSKEIDRFNINKAVLENVKSSESFKAFKEQELRLKKLNENVVKLRKQRYSENTRLNNHKNLEAELNSLNLAISLGKVHCDECGSENITYKSKNVNFDISNKEVRRSILLSLENNIIMKKEAVSRIDYEISVIQKELNNELTQVSPELRDLILFQDELKDTGGLDQERSDTLKEISLLTQKIQDSSTKQEGFSKQQKELVDKIVKIMNEIYSVIDETGVQTFTSLFTKRSVNYSGSEEQEFYFSKIYALYVVFKHKFPIIIDSFRDRELSSFKELKMIEIFENLDKQVIVTSTLKKEEYIVEKYETYGAVTALDYSSHTDSKILTSTHNNEFLNICKEFGVTSL
ncbi:hypothetical protein CWB77_00595 [Pseudoalteromonas sp. S1610]|uniref:hypothetical protein n=1 Tax=unclassified Pseudoalteromonas TaxID=194690 RepID=UPI00110A7AAE|nr:MULTISPECIES: hypothetical protein [unclassified Pseudoalteromonas]MCK8126713.1 hypothetical protein [Pseudoalteromonas sp. 2CM39R]TMP64032.1 hypothetical protein CWB77_00595 [Pseudoalteromonas sp. S1610]